MPEHPEMDYPIIEHPDYRQLHQRALIEVGSPTLIRRLEQAILEAPTVEEAITCGHEIIDHYPSPPPVKE